MVPRRPRKGPGSPFSAVLMLVLLGLSLQAMPQLRRPPVLLVVLTFLAMAKFYAHELVLGQVNLLFAVLVVLAVVMDAARSGRGGGPAARAGRGGQALRGDLRALARDAAEPRPRSLAMVGGLLRPAPAPRGAVRMGRQHPAARRLVAHGARDVAVAAGQPGQRVAQRDVHALARTGIRGAAARRG